MTAKTHSRLPCCIQREDAHLWICSHDVAVTTSTLQRERMRGMTHKARRRKSPSCTLSTSRMRWDCHTEDWWLQSQKGRRKCPTFSGFFFSLSIFSVFKRIVFELLEIACLAQEPVDLTTVYCTSISCLHVMVLGKWNRIKLWVTEKDWRKDRMMSNTTSSPDLYLPSYSSLPRLKNRRGFKWFFKCQLRKTESLVTQIHWEKEQKEWPR